MVISEKAKKLATHEVGWWKAHHEKDYREILRHMTEKHVSLYGMTHADADEAVKYKIEATKMHDEAEKLEDENLNVEAKIYWEKCEGLLQEYFALLLK